MTTDPAGESAGVWLIKAVSLAKVAGKHDLPDVITPEVQAVVNGRPCSPQLGEEAAEAHGLAGTELLLDHCWQLHQGRRQWPQQRWPLEQRRAEQGKMGASDMQAGNQHVLTNLTPLAARTQPTWSGAAT